MKEMKMLTRSIHPDFWSLKLAACEPWDRNPIGKPHCDCKESNEAFFNIKLNKENDLKRHAFAMVPVTTATKEPKCPYCGYLTPLLPPQDFTQYYANIANSKRAAGANKRRQKPVVGTNLETGETVTFESAQKAYRAGYGRVEYAMKMNKPVKGWVWKRGEA